MKPQCNTSADCLRELARVMDQFGIGDCLSTELSKYVRRAGAAWLFDKGTMPIFFVPNEWQFAIAEVEGKPVFIGDELYCNDIKIVASKKDTGFKLNHLSWNQPRPKTVTVELTVEDAEQLASHRIYEHMQIRIQDACKKALEQIK